MKTIYTSICLALALIGQAQNVPNLVACYPFSGDAKDMTGNGHDGTLNGATLTTDRFGNPNSAYSFNGTSSYIDVPNFNTIDDNNGELTICFWEKANSYKSQIPIVLYPDNTADRLAIHVQYDHSGTPATIWDYGDISGSGRLAVLPNPYRSTWNHYAFVVSASKNFMKIYQNDTLIGSANYSSSIVNKNRSIRLGGWSSFIFDGTLDDIQIYDRAVSASQVDSIFKGSGCGTTRATPTCGLKIPNLVACYPFSGNANDQSGNAHDGTVYGAVLTSDRFGKANSAYLFDATTSYIDVPNFNTIDDNNGELTICFWEKANNYKSQVPFVLYPDNTSDRLAIHVQYYHSGSPATIWDYGDISGSGRLALVPNPYRSTWNHYAFIVSKMQNTMKIYQNDTLIASANYSSSIVNKNRSIHIGGWSNFIFDGVLDDISIFDRALSATEVDKVFKGTYLSANFTSASTSACPNDSVAFIDQSLNNPKNWYWSFPGGSPSSSTSQNPTIKYDSAGTYNVTLIVSDSVNSDTLILKKYITVLPSPKPTVTINGASTFCEGTVNLSSSAATGNQWFFNGNSISGANSQNYFPSQSGFYTVKETDVNGCTGTSTLTSVTVLPKPTANIAGKTTTCAGTAVTLYATGSGTYSWSTTESTDTIVVTPTSTTSYTLTVTGSNGCTATAVQAITTKPAPPTPTILQNGSLLASSASTGNQWNLNGVPINGATGQFYTPTTSGFYSVTVSANGCAATSGLINVTVTGLNLIPSNGINFTIYPNPSGGPLNIDFGGSIAEKTSVTIFNALGEVIYSTAVPIGQQLMSIDLTGFARNGIYTLLVQNNSGTKIQKIVFAE